MPIDINELRDYKGGNPEKWRKYMQMRYKPANWVDEVIIKDDEWRSLRKQLDQLRREMNILQRDIIAPKKKKNVSCNLELENMKKLQVEIKDIEVCIPDVVTARDKLLKRIGNLVDPEVPISQNEVEDSIVISLFPMPTKTNNYDPTFNNKPLLPCRIADLEYILPPIKPSTHDDLLYRIGGYEPVRGQNIAGHRGYFLLNAGVMLNQAFLNYGIKFLRDHGYDVLQPPYMMNKDIMASLAQLEDFDDQLYKVSGKTDDPNGLSEKYLIATSEQPICGYHKNEWLEEKSLPKRYAGISTCFRKEAGSSGKDIRGIFRVHQFDKIEQFCITSDDLSESQAEQKRMLAIAEEFYQSLEFPYRVVCIVSGELNDAAIKKYDLEGWYPGQNTYRELVSCSNCTDYQARGVGTRCGSKKKIGGKNDRNSLLDRSSYVHMLNSTLCATGRAICCLLENFQMEDGVRIPKVLQHYMDGIDFLPFLRNSMDPTKGEKGKSRKN